MDIQGEKITVKEEVIYDGGVDWKYLRLDFRRMRGKNQQKKRNKRMAGSHRPPVCFADKDSQTSTDSKTCEKKKSALTAKQFSFAKKEGRKITSSDLIVLMRTTRGARNPIIFRLLLRTRRMYVTNSRLDFH